MNRLLEPSSFSFTSQQPEDPPATRSDGATRPRWADRPETGPVYPRVQPPATSRAACYYRRGLAVEDPAPPRGGPAMSPMSRRQFLAGATAGVAATALAAPSVHPHKGGGAPRFARPASVKILDPVWTAAYITTHY